MYIPLIVAYFVAYSFRLFHYDDAHLNLLFTIICMKATSVYFEIKHLGDYSESVKIPLSFQLSHHIYFL